jgi:uracil-DNA glycosylase family 4
MTQKKQKRTQLERLRLKAKNNENLPLKKGAKNLVFGSGNPNAEIVFIGEGPGFWEDKKGIPFVGNAGAFLNQLLRLIKLARQDVFITNMVMYRPPNNRDPLPEETAAFQPYVDGIIKIIKPKMIVTLGRFSMAKFIPGVYISRVHGQPRTVNWQGKEIVIVPMYHPAAGLRNQMIREQMQEDFEKLPKMLEELKTEKREVIKVKKPKQMQLV